MSDLSAREQDAIAAYRRGVPRKDIGTSLLRRAMDKGGVTPDRHRTGNHYIQKAPDPHKRGRMLESYREWLDKLQALRPGERIAYHVGVFAPRDAGIFAAAWDAAHQDPPAVSLVQVRGADAQIQYLAVGR